MKIFVHEGPGHFFGSVVVCAAESMEEAERVIRKELEYRHLRKEKLNITEKPIEGIIYSKNGDY